LAAAGFLGLRCLRTPALTLAAFRPLLANMTNRMIARPLFHLATTISLLYFVGPTLNAAGIRASFPDQAVGWIANKATKEVVGTGFVAGERKDVVTCAHVVPGTNEFVFVPRVETPCALKCRYLLPRVDLAVCTVASNAVTNFFRFGDLKRVRPGDEIYYSTFDVNQGRWIPNSAIVTAVGASYNGGATLDFLEFAGVGLPEYSAGPGVYSGGPVFNARGEVLAIIRDGFTRSLIGAREATVVNRAYSVESLAVLN
jgi:S1-C subfamily serine protease